MNKTTDKGAISNHIAAGMARRQRAERRFKIYGIIAVVVAMFFLISLFIAVGVIGASAFRQTVVQVDINFDADTLGVDPGATRDELRKGNYLMVLRASLKEAVPEAKSRRDRRALYALFSNSSEFQLRDLVRDDPSVVGTRRPVWLVASGDLDMLEKGNVRVDAPESERRLNDRQLAWVEKFRADGRVQSRFNIDFFTKGDSREPESAGLLGALMGSLYAVLVCFILSFGLGVMTAVYLEEFAPRNRWTSLIELNLNNLAAVPSVVFGLLGLVVFLDVFGLPRSVPLVGGMVLSLMTLPTVIIAGRAALTSVPPSVREAALGLGASPMQTVLHHTLPLAMPGVLTGSIIGMARALGETAPLLMIGMVAFIADVPTSPLQPASALPVQIFLWADAPERAFLEKTAAAIIVLLAFLVVMNLAAILLRKKYEIRW